MITTQARTTASRAPLGNGEWITVHLSTGAQVTLMRTGDYYRSTAIDCYTRRLRDPFTSDDEQTARDMAHRWTLELLRGAAGETFDVETYRNGATSRYTVPANGRTR